MDSVPCQQQRLNHSLHLNWQTISCHPSINDPGHRTKYLIWDRKASGTNAKLSQLSSGNIYQKKHPRWPNFCTGRTVPEPDPPWSGFHRWNLPCLVPAARMIDRMDGQGFLQPTGEGRLIGPGSRARSMGRPMSSLTVLAFAVRNKGFI